MEGQPYTFRGGKRKPLQSESSAAVLILCVIFADSDYASAIAPTGQPASHAPQSMHAFSSITAVASNVIAPTGQVPVHAPQETHISSLTLRAIV